MTQHPQDPGTGAEPVPEYDLEYDLAHEAQIAGEQVAAPAEQDGGPSVYVATQTCEYDGDYSYDLAHDIPRG